MIIETGIGNKGADIIGGVLGQMSDGIWENCASMTKYWIFADYTENGDIDISDIGYKEFAGRWYTNGWTGKTAEEIKKYFAQKIKQVCKLFIEDNKCGEWKRNCDVVVDYLHGEVTVADAYKAYDVLMGRKAA